MSDPIRILRQEVAKHGGTLERDEGGRYCVWQAVAPEGMEWADGGLASLRIEWLRGDTAWKIDAIQDAIERVRFGTQKIH
jgi:hypothetical protein